MTDTAVDPKARLRVARINKPFHVVLVEPEIPPNTGNIARLCAATGSVLHLVGELGFQVDEHAVRRAGLDYWHLVQVERHADLETAEKMAAASPPPRSGEQPPRRTWLFSARAPRSFFDVELSLGDVLVFGRESRGLPASLLEARPEQVVGIPTMGGVRSLNLANCVAIAVYEGLRQSAALAGAQLGGAAAWDASEKGAAGDPP